MYGPAPTHDRPWCDWHPHCQEPSRERGPIELREHHRRALIRMVMKLTSIIAFALAVTQSACVMVGGYSSNGGWWIWPGSFLSVLVVAIVVFLLLRRRR